MRSVSSKQSLAILQASVPEDALSRLQDVAYTEASPGQRYAASLGANGPKFHSIAKALIGLLSEVRSKLVADVLEKATPPRSNGICIAVMPNDCKTNGMCIALMLNPYKFNGICTAVMPNDCKNCGICIDAMPDDCNTNGIGIGSMFNHYKIDGT